MPSQSLSVVFSWWQVFHVYLRAPPGEVLLVMVQLWGWHLGFLVTSLVCLCTQAQSGHSGIAWRARGSRLYLPRLCVWWLRANTWYLSKAVKAPFSSLPRMASRQTVTELFTCQCWKVSAKISSDRCKWMDASLAFLCRDVSCRLARLPQPPSTPSVASVQPPLWTHLSERTAA